MGGKTWALVPHLVPLQSSPLPSPELDLPPRLTVPSAPPPPAQVPQLLRPRPAPSLPRLPQPSPFKNLLQTASVPQSPPSQPAFPVSAPLLRTTPLVLHPPSLP